MDPGLVEIATAGEQISLLAYLAAVGQRGALGQQMRAFHERFELLLTPTVPIAAFQAGVELSDPSRQSRWIDWAPFSNPFNLTQQPAASVPCGLTAEGLPVGLQIVGPDACRCAGAARRAGVRGGTPLADARSAARSGGLNRGESAMQPRRSPAAEPEIYLDDLAAGQTYTLGRRTIERAEIVDFARAFDPQPFHLDDKAGAASIYGRLIASGWHTVAIFMRLFADGL